MGAKLGELDRAGKQRAVRVLRERGAFDLRKSVSSVADALGVTRFTVYNYLNREVDYQRFQQNVDGTPAPTYGQPAAALPTSTPPTTSARC